MTNDRMDKVQVAEYFGVSTRQIERWVKTSILPDPVRIGKKNFWFTQSILTAEKFMQAKSEASMVKKFKSLRLPQPTAA